MLFPVLAGLVGAVLGFVGSRRLRRPEQAAQAASVARAVGGSLGRRRTLTPPELQRACFSEMVRHVRVDRAGQAHAPSIYELRLHPEDLEVVGGARRWFTEGLETALRTAARDNGWLLAGSIAITYVADPSRHLGVPASSTPETVGPARPSPDAAAGTHAGLLVRRGDTGEVIELGPSTVTIGRSRDRSISVVDDRVSRSHARIEPAGDGWTITDEGSSNGTRIDGVALPAGEPRRLRPGLVIGIGPVDLTVGALPTAAAPDAGTRALDDRTRSRISGEVLPPGGDRR